jgi:acyl-CoA synthetase (NDP forming)
MANTLRDVVQSREYDAVMLCVNLIWRQGEKLSEYLGKLAEDPATLVGVAWIAGRQEHLDNLNRSGVPVFSDPVRCARAMAARLKWESQRDTAEPDSTPAAQTAKGGATGDLGGFNAQEALLHAHGIATAPAQLCATFDAAKQAAARVGYPVAVKLAARGLAHKSEIGGVYLGVGSDARLKDVCARLDAIDIDGREGVLVQKMVSAPMEVFVGMKRDDVFGPVIVVGLGGIYVEIIRETVMRLAPFDQKQAERLIRSAQFAPLLEGARGKAALDVAALAKIVAGVSTLAVVEDAVLSLDLNPVMVSEQGALVADFKFEIRG